MKVPWQDGKRVCVSVLWDTVCSGIFVRTEHAERMNFPCKERKLHVKTLGGEKKEIYGKVYDCQIRDLKGSVYHFKNHGLDRVIGGLGGIRSKNVLQYLFLRMWFSDACV